MGYTDLDQLAINTIRVLAVCLLRLIPPLSPNRSLGGQPASPMASKFSFTATDTPQFDHN
jgi:hypothetical protein